MSLRFAAAIAASDAELLSPLRTVPGLEAALVDGTVWLRGEGPDGALDGSLRRVPGLARFALVDPDLLVPAGAVVPVARLPQVPFVPLTALLRPTLGAPALPARTPSPVRVRIVRASRELPATALLVDLAAFAAWVELAPAVRLARLAFAASADGRAVVRGAPLPPLRGTPLVERDGLLVPCGCDWEPAVDARTLRAALRLDGGVLALLAPPDRIERLAADAFAPATRSAVRATAGRRRG